VKRNVTFQSKRAQLRIIRLLELLADGMLPARTLAEKLHCDQSGVTEYLRYLGAEPRRVRVAGYEVVNGTKRRLYGLGAEPDEPMTAKTNQERYAAVLADPVRLQRTRELSRARHRQRRDAVPLEHRKRNRLRMDQSLEPRILSILAECPGYTVDQLAAKMSAGERSTRTAVEKLRAAGTIQRSANAKGKKHRYETPGKPMPAPLITKPQGAFAALGI
jgi:hypothetical protein